jgi:2-haloalkanoic acid dehalogenase type II
MVQAIIFDFYGTLVDYKQAYTCFLRGSIDGSMCEIFISQWIKRQREIVFSGPYVPYQQMLKASLRKAAEDLSINLPTTLKTESISKLITAFSDVPTALTHLQNETTCLLTNCDNASLQFILKRLNLIFSKVITAEDLGSYKPSKRNYESAARTLNLKSEDILFVTGTQWDAEAALKFGFRVAYINRNRTLPCFTAKPTFILENLNQLEELL